MKQLNPQTNQQILFSADLLALQLYDQLQQRIPALQALGEFGALGEEVTTAVTEILKQMVCDQVVTFARQAQMQLNQLTQNLRGDIATQVFTSLLANKQFKKRVAGLGLLSEQELMKTAIYSFQGADAMLTARTMNFSFAPQGQAKKTPWEAFSEQLQPEELEEFKTFAEARMQEGGDLTKASTVQIQALKKAFLYRDNDKKKNEAKESEEVVEEVAEEEETTEEVAE